MAIDHETVIIGLTGPVGSGCTYLATLIAQEFKFPAFQLSKIIRDHCEAKGLPNDVSALQTAGNELRAKNNNWHLVEKTLEVIGRQDVSGPIIIDGIKNVGEIKYLKKFPNFYLISPDAPKTIRKNRRSDLSDFDELDRRDQEEDLSYGQQVRKCVYYSDIIINNSEENNLGSQRAKQFVQKIIKPNIELILDPGCYIPLKDEALMTLAYAQSFRSSCMKRQVGAVITTPDGDIVSTGYNEVPVGSPSCLEFYGQCFKDKNRTTHINKIDFCPKCGKKLKKDIRCPRCLETYEKYQLSCDKEDCGAELPDHIKCEDCDYNIIKEFDIKDMSQCRSLHAEESAILKLPR